MSAIKIAIDGPAVSGKSSAAKHLAHELGFIYLDSGAIYRSITYASLKGFSLTESNLHQRLYDLNIRLTQHETGIGCRLYMGKENISDIIRTQKVTDKIQPISSNPIIRDWVTEFLRKLSDENDVVMDGRDIASVVFPDAQYKFFITASLDSRTKRRLHDIKDTDENLEYDEIFNMLKARDEGDMNRKIGPLVQVPEAILIDNSELNLEQTVQALQKYIKINAETNL